MKVESFNPYWLLPAALALVLAVSSSGCGSEDPVRGNAADAAFIDAMSEHHLGAIDMAQLAQTEAEHPELRGLAADIVDAQRTEIAVMKRIRAELPQPAEQRSDHSPGAHMDGASDADALRGARPFDRAFIDAMVPHHEDAVEMAQRLLDEGEHPQLAHLARGIVSAQEDEIARMRSWRSAWY